MQQGNDGPCEREHEQSDEREHHAHVEGLAFRAAAFERGRVESVASRGEDGQTIAHEQTLPTSRVRPRNNRRAHDGDAAPARLEPAELLQPGGHRERQREQRRRRGYRRRRRDARIRQRGVERVVGAEVYGRDDGGHTCGITRVERHHFGTPRNRCVAAPLASGRCVDTRSPALPQKPERQRRERARRQVREQVRLVKVRFAQHVLYHFARAHPDVRHDHNQSDAERVLPARGLTRRLTAHDRADSRIAWLNVLAMS